MSDSPRRLLLRVAVKFFILASALALFTVLMGGVRCTPQIIKPLAHYQHQSALSAAIPVERLNWPGGNILLLYRDETLLGSLENPPHPLADASSRQSRQPEGLPLHRARRASYLVLYDQGGEMGCPLEWLPPGHRQPPYQPWPGGFREICQNRWFDAAGRAIGQAGGRNIAIPPHHWQDEGLLILGDDGDNRAAQP